MAHKLLIIIFTFTLFSCSTSSNKIQSRNPSSKAAKTLKVIGSIPKYNDIPSLLEILDKKYENGEVDNSD